MNPDRLFDSLREQVKGLAPSNMDISSIEFEGPIVAIYVRNYDEFSGNVDVAKNMAMSVRRRVDIRPDPSTLEDPDKVEKKIRSMIPDSAEVTDINFQPDTGQAFVEAINPGAINDQEILSALKKESGWNVKVMRSPPIPSKTISDVRGYLRYSKDERSAMLKKVARNLVRPVIEGEQWVRVTTMGGFRQVGRSASLLTTRNSKILIDCGLDPGSDATPYFAIPEANPITDIDAVVITHAHLDHCGTLPALFKYGYEG
ncbi:MBL fold metallo-hydrolase, partial [Methanomethylophilus alvi]